MGPKCVDTMELSANEELPEGTLGWFAQLAGTPKDFQLLSIYPTAYSKDHSICDSTALSFVGTVTLRFIFIDSIRCKLFKNLTDSFLLNNNSHAVSDFYSVIRRFTDLVNCMKITRILAIELNSNFQELFKTS